MADALFSASFLNACLRHSEDVSMANIAPIVNTRGPLYVHPTGIVRRTTFHTLALYANELESSVGHIDIESGILELDDEISNRIVQQFRERGDYFSAEKFKQDTEQSVAIVDGIATVDESGKQWALAIVNRHPSQDVACTVRMNDDTIRGTFEGAILSGDSPDAFNSVEHPNRVVPEKKEIEIVNGVVRLPPHSLTIVKLTGSS
jgi:alpha-N-arabinofuranosidase